MHCRHKTNSIQLAREVLYNFPIKRAKVRQQNIVEAKTKKGINIISFYSRVTDKRLFPDKGRANDESIISLNTAIISLMTYPLQEKGKKHVGVVTKRSKRRRPSPVECILRSQPST